MNDTIAFGRALSDPIRVRILNALLQEELCVCELVDVLELSQSTVSTHLQTLRNARVVDFRKRRRWIIYRIDPHGAGALAAVFGHLPPVGARIERDNERLRLRIRLRVDGCCVLGVGQLRQVVGGVQEQALSGRV